VWAAILEDKFAKIRDIIDDYPYVAMDVQHPGVHGAPPSPSGAAEQVVGRVQLCHDEGHRRLSKSQGTQPMIDPDDRRRPCAWQSTSEGLILGSTSRTQTASIMDLHWLPAQVAQQRNYGSLPDTIVYMLLLYNLDFCFDWFGLSAHASYRTASGVRVLETWSPAESMTLPMLRFVAAIRVALRAVCGCSRAQTPRWHATEWLGSRFRISPKENDK
jgi:hypothetical protein